MVNADDFVEVSHDVDSDEHVKPERASAAAFSPPTFPAPSGQAPRANMFKRLESFGGSWREITASLKENASALEDFAFGEMPQSSSASSEGDNNKHAAVGSASAIDKQHTAGDMSKAEGKKAVEALKREDAKPAAGRKSVRLFAPKTPTQELQMDKVNFFMGVVNLVLSAFWLGKSPATWYMWFTPKAIVLYTVRYVVYRRIQWHYYMAEFCYFANLLLLVEIWLLPRSSLLHKAVFALCAGPLTLSMPALRNSLVLHSLDKTTSLFMHLSPAVMAWCLRWYPTASHQAHFTLERWHAYNHASVWELAVYPMGWYLVWAIAYYVKIFVLSTDKIKQKGYATLYTLMTAKKNSGAAAVVLRFPTRLQPIVYMFMHMLLTWFAVATTVLWWKSFWAHTVFLAACIAISAWNGANYYFDIFAVQYAKTVGIAKKQ